MDLAALIRETKNGSIAAQKAIFKHLYNRLWFLCLRYLKNRQEAEEVIQDCYCKFFKHIHSFNYTGDTSLYAWIKKILVNECLMHLRSNHVFCMVPESDAENISLREEALDNLTTSQIYLLILQLPVGYRTIFNLYAVEGYSHPEIARLLGISEGTSKSQLSKARSTLQKLLLEKGITYESQQSK